MYYLLQSFFQFLETNSVYFFDVKIGQKIKVGEVLGPNGNSGKKGKRVRRPALHFAAFYSKSPNWSFFKGGFLVKDGYWMDPVSFYRNQEPFDSKSIKKLKTKERNPSIGYKTKSGDIRESRV